MKKRILSICMALVLCLTLLPTAAFAATAVSYIDRSWDGSQVVSTTKSCTDYTAITSSTTSLSAGWYVVNQNVTFSDTLEANGAVNIILVDGYTLTAEKGILTSGGTLTIYGQTKETGKINAKAAIGGGANDKKATNVTINGGIVNATSSTEYEPAIGPGFNGNAGNITINGGTVTAKNTKTDSSSAASPAIGNPCTTKGGKITINGGTVTASTSATGRYWAPAIGRGCMSDSSTIEIEINGGTIHATTANSSATYSIGGNSTFTVNGGNIYANKGVSSAQNSDGTTVTLNTITLNGAKANTTVTSVSGVTGYGLNDVKTLDTNKLYFYLPADSSITGITAGSSYVCNDNLTFYTSHNFSAATCSQAKTCGRCGQTEGGIDSNNHNWSAWTTNNGTHTRTCSYNNSHTESGTCSGGTATCESAAICSTCKQEYEPKKEHNYTYTANAEQHSITESCDQGCNYKATVTLSAPADLTYNGKAKEAVVTGRFKNVTTPTVTYSTDDGNAPVKVGSYTASITAGGKTVSVEFAIAKKSTTATVAVNETYTYNGEQITPTNVTVTDGDGNTIDAKEYTLSYGENIKAGTGTVTATFDNSDSYSVSNSPVTGTFTIAPKPLTDAMVSVTGEFTYDGDEKSPTVTVTDGEKTLVLDTDYELSGDKTGTAAKTYTLTISGKGNYGSSVQKTWTIGNATLTNIAVEQDGTLTYDGTPQTPQVKTTAPDGVSFTYCSTENGTYGTMPAFTNAGTYKVYYKADAANYETCSGYFTVTIDRKEVTPTVTVAGGSIYTGNALTPAVTVEDGGTTIPDSEYKVSYSDNIEVGTATVTVTDKADGNYAIKEATQTFEIAKASMTDKNTTGSAPYGATGEVNLTDLIELGGKLEITATADTDSVLNGDASLDGNTLKFAFNDADTLISKSASITVTVKDCKNYEDYKILVTVSVTDKQAPTVTAAAITQTYSGEALKDAVITGETGGVNGTWSWKDGKAPKDVADSTSNGKTWTVVFTPTDTVKYKAVETTVAVTINPRGVTISGLSVENKTYDGTTNATVTGTASLDGVISDDEMGIDDSSATATFADKNVGTGKTVTFSGYSLGGSKANNYTLTAQPTATADIAQKSVTVSGVTAVDRAYNGTNTVSLSDGTVDGKVNGDTVTVDLTTATGTMETPDASDNPKSVTISGVKLAGTDAGNYVLSAQPDGVTVNISRIAYTGTTTATGSAKYGNPGEVDLSGLIQAGGTAASVSVTSDSHSALNGDPALDGSTLKFKFENDSTLIGKEAEINVSVTGCTNYTDYTITVTVTVADKAAPAVTAPTAIANLTYNGSAQTLINAATTTGGTLQYKLGENGTWSAELPKAQNADTYTVYYKVVGNDDYADVAANSIPVTIGKKDVTVKPKSYIITKGSTIPTFALEYVGLVDGDALHITATPAFVCYEADGSTAVSTSTAVGSYTITWTNSDAFNFDGETNYTVNKVETGTLTINNKPSSGGGGSSSSSTTITVPVSSDHASVDVKAEVSKGNATVEVSDKQIDKVIADHAGEVTIDVSGLKNVESATVPSHVVEKANEAENTGLTVSLPAGSVTLDETALESVTENANGKDVTVSVKTVSESELTTAQKTAIGEQASVAVVVDVNIVMGTVKQSSFNGGKLTISVPYTPKKGEDTSKLTVWFIRDDGTIENKGGYYDVKNKCFVFETDHLSQYILVNTNEMQTFVDVPADAYFANAVSWAAGKGITGGVDATHFMPHNACTRAQIVTFLWRAAGSPEPKAASSFSDVPADAYYAKAVAWAVENGITGGIGNDLFAPDLTCTRAQAAAFLFRYAAANGMEAVTLQELVGGYGDAAQVPGYAIPAFNWALAQGILQGYNGNLMPNNDCTRAQIVTMLYRLLGK